MKTAGAVLAICLAATGLLACPGSSDDNNDDASNPLALPRVMTESEALEDLDCVVICKGTPNYPGLPAGVGVAQVEGLAVSDEVLDRCEKILPCRALRKGNH